MWDALQQRVHKIDWRKQSEEGEKGAMVCVKVRFVID
jgi:hypothetical protein